MGRGALAQKSEVKSWLVLTIPPGFVACANPLCNRGLNFLVSKMGIITPLRGLNAILYIHECSV